jgi:hypothetical protein
VDLAEKVLLPGSNREYYKITAALKNSETDIDLQQLKDSGFLLAEL